MQGLGWRRETSGQALGVVGCDTQAQSGEGPDHGGGLGLGGGEQGREGNLSWMAAGFLHRVTEGLQS